MSQPIKDQCTQTTQTKRSSGGVHSSSHSGPSDSSTHTLVLDLSNTDIIIEESEVYIDLTPCSSLSGRQFAQIIAAEFGVKPNMFLQPALEDGSWKDLVAKVEDSETKRAILYLYARVNPNDRTLIRCPWCGKVFLTETGRLMHKMSVHPLDGMNLY